MATGKEARVIAETGHSSSFQDIAFSPDGTLLAGVSLKAADGSRDDARLRLWQVATGNLVREIKPGRGILATFAFSPDSRALAMYWHNDKTVSLWEVATGKERGRLTMPGTGFLTFSPDGRTLAGNVMADRLTLWDVRADRELGHFQTPYHVTSGRFSPDGKTMITGQSDTTALVWDAAALSVGRPEQPATELDAKRADALWSDLADDDAGRTWNAIKALSVAPQSALALFRTRLRPAAALNSKQIMQWIAELGSAQFAVRQRAQVELSKVGESVEPHLRKVLEGKPDLDTQKRVEQLLDELPRRVPPAETLRVLRCVEVLETIGTLQAKGLLEQLAGGSEADRLTRASKAALERLSRRPADGR
jgi:hypothetical protein